jgi:cellulose synthase operon protein C
MNEEPLMSQRKRLAAIARELESPDTTVENVLDRMRAETRPAGAQEMLRRAAIPRRFDAAMYNRLLRDPTLTEDLSFETFTTLPDVQKLPRDAGYTIVSDTRFRLIVEWRRDAQSWVAWNRKIADYLEHSDPHDVPGRLYHLILAKAPDAAAFFEKQFEPAEAAFDLTRCYALLAVLDDLQSELGTELASARLRRQQQYRARALFANDYYRTNTYQQRPGALASFETMWNSAGDWIFHMHATGGMGKTMFLRWLVARHLVPLRVACAKVDFDEINQANVARYPWLLLLPLCRQLNEQLPKTYFTELIEKLRPLEVLLHPPSRLRDPQRVDYPAPIYEQGDLHSRLFASVLREANTEIAIVLDTVEGMTLADQFGPIFALFKGIHGEAPKMRLLLSGRYDVSLRLRALAAALESTLERSGSGPDTVRNALETRQLAMEFETASVSCGLEPFSRDEARRYLRARAVTNGELVDAIVAKVYQHGDEVGGEGCNPFTVALLADLALGRDSLTAEEVSSFPSAHYVYLVERVVKRIPEQPLRWVVRYGVIPRRLTPDFIEAVLLKPLRRSLNGELVGDVPQEHVRQGHKIRERDIWTPDPSANVTTEQLWRDLCRYEGPRGWIWRLPGPDEVVQFHGDVVDPMRDLLSSQPLFRTLQVSAITYFTRLAEEQPTRWADWICEAIFHQFQLEGEGATPFWMNQLNSPQAKASPIVRRQIAREVLRREYADEECRPLVRGEPTTELISKETLARAHAETATAIIIESGYVSSTSSDWLELTKHVRLAVELGGGDVLPPYVAASVAASEKVAASDYEGASRALSNILQNVTDPLARFGLELQMGDLQAMQRHPSASAHYREAIRLHPGRGKTSVSTSNIRLRLGSWYASEGHLLSARDAYSEAYAAAGGDIETRNYVSLQLAWSALKAGDFDTASDLIDGAVEAIGPSSQYFASLLRLDAWRWLQIENPTRAAQSGHRALKSARTADDEARAHDLLARVYMEMLELAESASHWEHAIQIFTQSGAPNAVESCMIDCIGMKALVLGDYKEADGLISEAERLPGMRDAEVWARVQIYKLLVRARTDDIEGARTIFTELSKGRSPEWPAHLRVRVATAALALGLLHPDDVTLQEYWDLLDEVRPAFARVDLVASLKECPSALSDSPYWRSRFIALFPPPKTSSPGFAAVALKIAEVHRVFGSPSSAKELLTPAIMQLRERQHLRGQLRAIEALRRVGVVNETALFSATSPAPERFADAVLVLERAKTRIEHGVEALDLLHSAERLVSKEPILTRWHARLSELKAVVALRGGDHATFQRERSLAVEVYDRLGDIPGASRARRSMSEPQQPEDNARDVSDLSISSMRRTITRINTSHLKTPPSGFGSLEAIAESLVSNKSAAAWLRETVLSPDDREFFMQPGTEARFEVPQGLPSALPLEWMLPERFVYRSKAAGDVLSPDTTRWIQKRLSGLGEDLAIDGKFGRATKLALRRFAQSAGLRSSLATLAEVLNRLREVSVPSLGGARVLLVQPSANAYEASEVAFESVAGATAESLYESTDGSSKSNRSSDMPFYLETIREPDIDTLEKQAAWFKPTVVHIVCAVKMQHGVAFLDFARRRRKQGDMYTAQALHRALNTMQDAAPMVILDVARPPSMWEAITALLIRNQFAADLFALEGVAAIVATGLAEPWDTTHLGLAITRVLRDRRPSLRQLIEAIHVHGSTNTNTADDISRQITYSGAALFATEPELNCHAL